MLQYNTVQACSDIKRDTIPKLLARPDDVVLLQQLTEIIECVETDCAEGFGKCRDAIAPKQLYSGEYQPVHKPVSIRSFLTETWRLVPKLTIVVDEHVPEWVSLCIPLLLIIMQNAMHNAKSHGERDGETQLTVKLIQVGRDWFLQIYLQNKPGKNHGAALQMQSEFGENMLQSTQAKDSLGKIGSAMSTFLGMGEIQTAAAAMSATATLSFHADTEAAPACVLFLVQMLLVAASEPCNIESNAQPMLRAGTFMICADDDKIARMMYKSLAKKCGVTTPCTLVQFTGGIGGIVQAAEFKVLGETFDEADSIASVVTTVASQYGEGNVVVLLDQQYASPCLCECLPTVCGVAAWTIIKRARSWALTSHTSSDLVGLKGLS